MDQKLWKKSAASSVNTNRAAAAQRVFQPMINNRPPTNSTRREPPASNSGNGRPLLAIKPTVPSKPVILLMPDMRKICAINSRPSSGPIRCNEFLRAVPYRDGALRRKNVRSHLDCGCGAVERSDRCRFARQAELLSAAHYA